MVWVQWWDERFSTEPVNFRVAPCCVGWRKLQPEYRYCPDCGQAIYAITHVEGEEHEHKIMDKK